MFNRLIDAQYRRPSGLIGQYFGRRMARQHQPENAWTVALLDARPNDQILEIGFGPGVSIEALARTVSAGRMAGVDASPAMVRMASRRNQEAIRAGRVDLRQGDVTHLPFGDATFYKAYGIHTIYFWPRPLEGLKEVWRVLRPGGMLAITVLPKEQWPSSATGRVGTPDCVPYSGLEIARMMLAAGFRETRIAADSEKKSLSNYSVVAIK